MEEVDRIRCPPKPLCGDPEAHSCPLCQALQDTALLRSRFLAKKRPQVTPIKPHRDLNLGNLTGLGVGGSGFKPHLHYLQAV